MNITRTIQDSSYNWWPRKTVPWILSVIIQIVEVLAKAPPYGLFLPGSHITEPESALNIRSLNRRPQRVRSGVLIVQRFAGWSIANLGLRVLRAPWSPPEKLDQSAGASSGQKPRTRNVEAPGPPMHANRLWESRDLVSGAVVWKGTGLQLCLTGLVGSCSSSNADS